MFELESKLVFVGPYTKYRSDLVVNLQDVDVFGNFKSSDWSTQFMQFILLVLSLVSISWGTPNLYCGSAD
jgi:hypothetical protein